MLSHSLTLFPLLRLSFHAGISSISLNRFPTQSHCTLLSASVIHFKYFTFLCLRHRRDSNQTQRNHNDYDCRGRGCSTAAAAQASQAVLTVIRDAAATLPFARLLKVRRKLYYTQQTHTHTHTHSHTDSNIMEITFPFSVEAHSFTYGQRRF